MCLESRKTLSVQYFWLPFGSYDFLFYLFSSVHDYVGFGLMDASRMVDAALNWTTVPPKVKCSISGPFKNR